MTEHEEKKQAFVRDAMAATSAKVVLEHYMLRTEWLKAAGYDTLELSRRRYDQLVRAGEAFTVYHGADPLQPMTHFNGIRLKVAP